MARIALITIHGTFARNAEWVQPDSALLRRALADLSRCGDTCDVIPFRWSGANTFSARRRAGNSLAALVQSIKSESAAYDEVYLIAHSHGGSLVAYACRDQPQIKPLITGVVTLSTPWFTVRPERFASEIRLFIARCVSLLVLCGILLVVVPVIAANLASEMLPPMPESIYQGLEAREEGSIFRDPLFTWIVVAASLTLAFAVPAGAALGAAWTVIHTFFMRKLRGTEERFLKAIRELASALNTATISMPPTIVLVGSSDEASSTLRLIQSLGAVSRELFGRLSRIAWAASAAHGRLPGLLRIPSTVIVFAFFAGAAVSIGVFGAIQGDALPAAVTVGAGSLSLVIAAVISTSALSGISFGTFSVFAQAYCRFGVESTRFGSGVMVLVDTSTRVDRDRSWNGALLSHSAIYLFEEGIAATCEAIRRMQEEFRARASANSVA